MLRWRRCRIEVEAEREGEGVVELDALDAEFVEDVGFFVRWSGGDL